ncbi:MAG: hypothetical protein EOP07_07930 [Proteobacteria bacterium]|nr:MAG: hypothetical protein EOP07_07930 [Pseudomonadota bacterium]
MNSITPIPYSRAVSFSERSFFSGPTIRKQALSVQYVFEGKGSLSVDELRAAVTEATASNPGARLALRGVLKWLRWEAVGAIPGVQVVDQWDVDGELPPELLTAFDVMNGPTCEVLLSNGPKPKLVFRCFHGVMDGRGLIHFAEEVFRVLRGEKCKGSPSTITDSQLIKDLVGKKHRPMRPMTFQPPMDPGSPSLKGVHGHRFYLEGHIPSLPAKVAAGLIRLAQTRKDKTISFMTPVDIRYYKTGIRSMGNLSSPIYFDGSSGEDWPAIQEKIMNALLEREALRFEASEAIFAWIPLWATKHVINKFEAFQKRKRLYMFSTYISHITLPKKAVFACPDFQCESAFVTPPQTEFFPLGVSAITMEGKTHLTVFGPRYIANDQQLKEVASYIRAVVAEG